MIQNQMTALFTHAYNIYGLKSNPCKKIKKMGKSDANRLDFWTKDEYDKFIATIDHDDRYYTLFEILFWTGCRVGELLALTKSCFLQVLFGKSCKIFLENVASPNWRKLQSLDWQLSCQPHSHCRPNLVVTA